MRNAFLAAGALTACGGGPTVRLTSSASAVEARDPADPPISADTNICSADVVDGGACNDVRDVGRPVTPTCTTGAVPVGAGGRIEDGTYTLVEETFYNVSHCPSGRISATLVVGGGCHQLVGHSLADERPVEVRASTRVTVHENHVVEDVTCMPVGARRDAPTKTFTSDGKTLMFFVANSGTGSSNPDRVEVLVKR